MVGRLIVGGMVSVVLATICYVTALANGVPEHTAAWLMFFILAGPIVSLVGVLSLLAVHKPIVTTARMADQHLWLNGVHPEFLASLPDWRGDAAISVEENIVADAPLNPFEESVLAELEKIRNPKGNWVQALFILAVSLLLFVGLGMRNNPIAFTVMLVGVLLVHEMGHYVGMRIFGYRNVRMFFIPFFGAAVSGQRTDVKSYQEAIVTLLGPLPGLCLSVVLLGVAFVPGIGNEVRRNLLWASALFGLINGFNLLPVFPLDGGRLLNQILFSRNRYLEGVFQVLAALAFIAYGVTQGRYFFLFLGVWFVTSVGPRFKTNTIAQRIGRRLGDELPPMNEPIPLPIVRANYRPGEIPVAGRENRQGRGWRGVQRLGEDARSTARCRCNRGAAAGLSVQAAVAVHGYDQRDSSTTWRQFGRTPDREICQRNEQASAKAAR